MHTVEQVEELVIEKRLTFAKKEKKMCGGGVGG